MNIESINNSYGERIGKQYGFDNTIMTNGEFYQHQLPQWPLSNDTESSRLVHIKPTPRSDNWEEQIQNEPALSTKTTITLEFYGDGDSITNEAILPYLKLLNQGKIIDNVTLSEIEISPQTLHDFLLAVKPTLKALNLSRVALDHEHLEMLNKLELGLDFLSLSYVEADQSNAFKEQKNREVHKSFNINQLEFKRFCPNLKFLQLRGMSLKKETFNTILDTYSSSLEILILENIKTQKQSKKELVQHILQNLTPFRNLKGLSLANNNLDAIDLSEEQEENNKILFPENLKSLNLNGCNLDHKQIYDLMDVLSKSRCPLQDLHLVGSYLYARTLEAISKFTKTTGNMGIFLLEISKQPIDPSGRNIFKDPKAKHSLQIKNNDLFTELLDASADLEALKSLKNSPDKPEWINQLTNQHDFVQSLPYLLKIFRETKFFNDAYRKNLVDFSTNPKMMIPKHDFNELLSKIASEMNNTEVLVGTSIVEVYIRLIRHVHPTLLRDDDWAKLPLKNQRDKFLELMKELGYNHIVKKHKDCFEDQFVMAIKKLKQVSYDYTLATFSLFWYFNQVSVKFNLSDDWYLDRKQRVNRYAPPNQDFLISFCSEWNNHTNDYVFELDIKDDGEPEIKFKSSIWKDGDLNVAKALLIAIDKGFVMLEALHKMELFDKGDIFKGVEDSKNVRKILKEKLRKYAKSQDFQNLLKQEIAILGEPEEEEEEEEAVEEEQQ